MKQILIYDKKSYLYRFIKINFENASNFKILKYDSKFRYSSKIDYIIFAFYDESDIVLFADVYLKNKRVIVLYENLSEFRLVFEKCKSLNCININNQKKIILTNLKWLIN